MTVHGERRPQDAGGLGALNEFARAVLAAQTLAEVAEASLTRLVSAGFAQRAYMSYKLPDGSNFDRLVTRDPAEAGAYQVKGLANMTVSRMMTWQEELFIPDAMADQSLGDEARIYEVDVGSALCLPLGEGAEIAGALYLDRSQADQPFGPASLSLARHQALLMGQACKAITRQDQLLRRMEHMEGLLGVFRTVAGVIELPTLLDQVTQMSLSITKAERAFVLLVEGTELAYGTGRNREAVLPAAHFKQLSHSVCQQVLETQTEVCVFDTGQDAAMQARQSVVNLKLQGVVAVPLMGRDGLVGILYIDSSMRSLDGLKQEMKLLRTVGSVAALAIENARMYQRVTVDAKTGLYTRGLFEVRIEEEIARSRRYSRPFGLLMIEMDGLYELARDHGDGPAHVATRLVAQIIRKQLRGGIDFPARFDDLRMALILPETGQEGAWTFAERVREKVAQVSFAGPTGEPLSLTVSIGIALWRGAEGQTPFALVDSALAAVGRARDQGNRTVFASEG